MLVVGNSSGRSRSRNGSTSGSRGSSSGSGRRGTPLGARSMDSVSQKTGKGHESPIRGPMTPPQQ